MKNNYNRNKGCYAVISRILKKNKGMILTLDNGREAYCKNYKSMLKEGSSVFCIIRKNAYMDKRMVVEILDVIENAGMERKYMAAA